MDSLGAHSNVRKQELSTTHHPPSRSLDVVEKRGRAGTRGLPSGALVELLWQVEVAIRARYLWSPPVKMSGYWGLGAFGEVFVS